MLYMLAFRSLFARSSHSPGWPRGWGWGQISHIRLPLVCLMKRGNEAQHSFSVVLRSRVCSAWPQSAEAWDGAVDATDSRDGMEHATRSWEVVGAQGWASPVVPEPGRTLGAGGCSARVPVLGWVVPRDHATTSFLREWDPHGARAHSRNPASVPARHRSRLAARASASAFRSPEGSRAEDSTLSTNEKKLGAVKGRSSGRITHLSFMYGVVPNLNPAVASSGSEQRLTSSYAHTITAFSGITGMQVRAHLPTAAIGVSAADTRNALMTSPQVSVSTRNVSSGGGSPISPLSNSCRVTALAKPSACLNCPSPV